MALDPELQKLVNERITLAKERGIAEKILFIASSLGTRKDETHSLGDTTIWSSAQDDLMLTSQINEGGYHNLTANWGPDQVFEAYRNHQQQEHQITCYIPGEWESRLEMQYETAKLKNQKSELAKEQLSTEIEEENLRRKFGL